MREWFAFFYPYMCTAMAGLYVGWIIGRCQDEAKR